MMWHLHSSTQSSLGCFLSTGFPSSAPVTRSTHSSKWCLNGAQPLDSLHSMGSPVSRLPRWLFRAGMEHQHVPSSNFSLGSSISSSSSSSGSSFSSSSSSPFAALPALESTPEAAFPPTWSPESEPRLSGVGPDGSYIAKISKVLI
jgi:hypothetical protein